MSEKNCWKCHAPIMDGSSDGLIYTSDPPKYAHRNCVTSPYRTFRVTNSAGSPKSWQQQYKEKYEAMLNGRMYGSYTVNIEWVQENEHIVPRVKMPNPSVGKISRDDYEVQ